MSKFRRLTLMFWIIKISRPLWAKPVATAVSMSMNLGYLVGTGDFAAVFIAAVYVQIKAKNFLPHLLDDDHRDDHRGHDHGGLRRPPLGIGYAVVRCAAGFTSRITFHLVQTLGNGFPCNPCASEGGKFYWVTIMFRKPRNRSWRLAADSAGLGYSGSAVLFGGSRVICALYFWTKISRTFLFLGRIYFTRPLGAVVRRLLDKRAIMGGSS